jgi:hypothetical protein
MASDIAFFVQFPHPRDEPPASRFTSRGDTTQWPLRGEEAIPPGHVMPWNTEPTHFRKFLISPGRYLDGHGEGSVRPSV